MSDHQGVTIKEYHMTGTKKSAKKCLSIVFTAAFIFLMAAAIIPGVHGASAVDLGSAGNFVSLTKSGISTTGTTTITGDIGTSPIAASAITGFGLSKDPSTQFSTSSLVTGRAYAADYTAPTPALLTTAVSNMESAYTSAAGQVPPSATELYAGNLGGRTLAPGVYKWSTGVLVPASTVLTLDAQGNGGAFWVFQVAGDFTMNSASQVALINGARAENVYWQIAGPSGAIIGSGAHAEGIILTQKAITLNSGASLHGRALAQTAVTLIANTVTAPTATRVPNIVPTASASTTTSSLGTDPGQTVTTSMTYDATNPGQTTSITPVSTEKTNTMLKLNVGGDSAVYMAEVTGTENDGLVVTGVIADGPGQGIKQPPGTVYQYVDLRPAQFVPIDHAVISFTIPVSWFESNGISPHDVVLNYLDGNVWTASPTTLVRTTNGLVYFSAASPGFSRLAIIAHFPSDVSLANATAPLETQPQKAPAVTATTIPSVPQPTAKSPVPFWLPVTAVFGVLLFMGVLTRRNE